ncbi:MAG: thioesterase family protein [Bacteroidota bacterium]
MQELLSTYAVIREYPVQWGEMDAANHVNNLIYLRWSESGRIAFFEHLGWPFSFGKGIGPILGWQDCKYIFPITYPDTAIVGTKVVEILTDRFVIESAIFTKKHQRIAAISKQQIIPYDYTNLRKVPIPEDWLIAIQQQESSI